MEAETLNCQSIDCFYFASWIEVWGHCGRSVASSNLCDNCTGLFKWILYKDIWLNVNLKIHLIDIWLVAHVLNSRLKDSIFMCFFFQPSLETNGDVMMLMTRVYILENYNGLWGPSANSTSDNCKDSCNITWFSYSPGCLQPCTHRERECVAMRDH